MMLDGVKLYDGSWGPTKYAAVLADSPLEMFLYFLPKTLWFMIEKETNSYREACFPGIAQQQRDKQLQVQAKDPKKSVAPLEEIEEKLRRVKSIESHEIFHVIGLLVARTLCSHTDGLEKHWSARADGAVPPPAGKDMAWKVRHVVEVIENTFQSGYRFGPRISFDEGTIPNWMGSLSNEYEDEPDLGSFSGVHSPRFARLSSESSRARRAVVAAGAERYPSYGQSQIDRDSRALLDRVAALELFQSAEFAQLQQELRYQKAQVGQAAQTASNIQVELGTQVVRLHDHVAALEKLAHAASSSSASHQR
ncbi:hypothetical protein PC110_g10941 [Phytophthora cactorum]|uniref:PiggyBac transposable element-derived protein domain-containing protein n=1 Tax=Phytophthora cactorum TaxID=29920 RepID=A0A329S7P2_9STRA|nr:hypothetical protein PC110_g10941 [Phytophthora cactorum]